MPKVTYEFNLFEEEESEYYFRNGLKLFAAMQKFQNWLKDYHDPEIDSCEMHAAIIDNFNFQLEDNEVSLWR